MRKPIFCVMLLLLLGCCAASRVQAQVEYEYSVMWYDDTTVWGYSATEVDYYCAYDYSAYVESYLYSQYGLLNSGSDEGDYIAQVYTSAPADPDTLYALYGYHYVIARYYYIEIQRQPEGCWPCDGCNTDCYYFYENWYWYDPLGFTYSYPGYYGQWWYFYGYGPPVWAESEEYVYLGSTSDSDSTHGNPDHLQIMDDVFRTVACDTLQREITYKIVDVNNHSAGSVSVRENVSSVVDTCNGQVPSHSTSCLQTYGTYTDYLRAACPEFGDYDCGFDIPDEQWIWCTDSGGSVPLALLDYDVHHNRIIVSGYQGRLPLRWYVRADGSIQRR